VFDKLPRTGLPPYFASHSAYERATQALTSLNLIEDTTKIWWDLRPSFRFPTLETRICDVPPRMEDTLTLAAVIQCLCRMLWRLSRLNQRWRLYDSFLVGENRWRAQRYGVSAGLIDFGAGQIKGFGELADELLGLIAEDAEALGCLAEVTRIREIAAEGTGADRQRAVRDARLAAGDDPETAMRAVVAQLVEEFREGL
jgi:carboxylate-amine ligase